MFVRRSHPFSKSLSTQSVRERGAKALPVAGLRPQIERLEDRTLLSASSQALVAQMYQDLLQRSADAAGLAHWSSALDQGTSPAQVALDLAQSPEARALQVQALYQQFLHRPADSAGLDTNTQALAAGETLEQVAASLVASPEYYQNRGGGSDSGFLTALYQDALNRQIDTSGAVVFGQALAGGTTRAQLAQTIFASTELRQDVVQRDYQYFLHRSADASGLVSWTQALQNGMRDEQTAAAIVGSREYAQNVQAASGSLQQTLLPDNGMPPLNVLVVNTTSQPVPVTGATGTSGTVQAQQSGPWTVGISGTPTVNVASSSTNPVFVRDVDNGTHPFQTMVTLSGINAASGSFLVPAGKRLVIEFISAEISIPPLGGPPFSFAPASLLVQTQVSGSSVSYDLAPVNEGFVGTGVSHDELVASQTVKIYADPGTAVTITTALLAESGPFINATVGITGYLINVP